MATQTNTVNSGKAKSSARRGLRFRQEDLTDLHWKQGLSLTDIGRRYGVTGQAIKYWMNKFGIEHRAQLQEVLFEASPTLSYVLGVLHGDGFLYYNPANNHHHILLSVVDKPFAESFAAALRRLGLRAVIRRVPARGNAQAQWKVWSTSKRFSELWHRLSPNGRLDLGLTYERDFIRGFYESEGSIMFHRGSLELAIYNTNVTVLRRVQACVEARGFAPKWYEKVPESGKQCGILCLHRSLEVKRFIAWVAPCIKYLPRGYVNPDPIQGRDTLAGLETTKDD